MGEQAWKGSQGLSRDRNGPGVDVVETDIACNV